nr:MAG TPA: hypothetical protein [Caudoviricetes sp.]
MTAGKDRPPDGAHPSQPKGIKNTENQFRKEISPR